MQVALDALAHNLWWSWDDEATAMWRDLDPAGWERCGHDPVALLASEPPPPPGFAARVDAVYRRFQAYLAGSGWCREAAPDLGRVAYLSMEFGLHESMPLYSGGLGVLAGDHLRSASDLGVPLVGVGILWREGYFRQGLTAGRQSVSYETLHPERSAVRRVEAGGAPLVIDVPLGGLVARLAVWRLDVGRVPLYLLDAELPQNPPEFRSLTRRLYGGDHVDRIHQETLLGLGSLRLLRALDQVPAVVHLNEGHCAFAALQAAVDELPDTGDWRAACARARERFVFTTHTPVPAGHDRFAWPEVRATLGPWRETLKLDAGAFMELGRVKPDDEAETLCMTVVALRQSAAANGVSKLHGEVSRRMWRGLWPDRAEADVPIGHITNGVHPLFWVAAGSRALFDRRLPGWRDRPWDPEVWSPAARLAGAEIDAMRDANRAALLQLVEQRTGVRLDPGKLTVGFARRFAPYKRGDLVLSDPYRLAAWLDRGAQLVFAGKAHPRDEGGQAVLARVAAFAADRHFAGRVVIVPDYDIEVGRAITAGADLWLNNPRRPHEASGTSGEKVVYNGGLNASVLDGWWVEGFDGTNGWAIGDGREWDDEAAGDAADAEALYALLEGGIWSTWTDRPAWHERIRRSLVTCAPAFSSHRMVQDYVRDLYLPRCRAIRE